MTKEHQHTAASVALVLIRLVVVLFCVYCLATTVHERRLKFKHNGIVYHRYTNVTSRPWFEMALCFGPRFTADTIQEYSHKIRKNLPEQNATDDTPLHSGLNRTLDALNSSMGSEVHSYKLFFGSLFNWKDDVLDLASLQMSQIIQHLPLVRHRVALGGNAIVKGTTYSDIPLLFQYVMCRNYSYQLEYKKTVTGKNLVVDDFAHEVYVSKAARTTLFRNGTSEYMDLYVYPRGHFTEFPLVADHIPYRLDLNSPQLLRVDAKRTDKKTRVGDWECNASGRHSYVNCLTWCLVRGLLKRARCIMPLLMPYVYNTTGWTLDATHGPAAKEPDTHWRGKYPSTSSWPWMKEYTNIKLCSSRKEFMEMFSNFTAIFYPRGRERYPLSPHCATECPPECKEYAVNIHSAGRKLTPRMGNSNKGTTDHDGKYFHSVTVLHSTTMEVLDEKWMYSLSQLLVETMAVVSFTLGLSTIALHDCCFNLTQWGMLKLGLMDAEFEDGSGGDSKSKHDRQRQASGDISHGPVKPVGESS